MELIKGEVIFLAILSTCSRNLLINKRMFNMFINSDLSFIWGAFQVSSRLWTEHGAANGAQEGSLVGKGRARSRSDADL